MTPATVQLAPVAALLLALLAVDSRKQGPIRALSVAWLICLAPLATGVVSYGFAGTLGFCFTFALMGSIGFFVLGSLLHEASVPDRAALPPRAIEWLSQRDYAETLPIARLCWWLGCAGAALITADFYLYGGAGLDDVAALRDAFIGREATILAKIGSVLTWACLYSFGFALIHRARLGRLGSIRFMVPVIGYFLVAVFSAGRQTAFQIMIFTTIFIWIMRVRAGSGVRVPGRSAIFAIAVSLLMISYMGYVAVVRNDARISADKVEVLVRIFDLELSPVFEHVIAFLGEGVRTTLVEGMVYFSSSIALFEKFLETNLGPFYGAMSFPFAFRQVESLTGLSVVGAYISKVDAMQGLGVIGVGWTTAVSSYILDFGLIGACFFLVLQGYYSSLAWRRAMSGAGFHDTMIAAVVVAAAVYMPLLAATSDTNLFLVWLFCVAARRWNVAMGRRLRQRIEAVSRPLQES